MYSRKWFPLPSGCSKPRSLKKLSWSASVNALHHRVGQQRVRRLVVVGDDRVRPHAGRDGVGCTSGLRRPRLHLLPPHAVLVQAEHRRQPPVRELAGDAAQAWAVRGDPDRRIHTRLQRLHPAHGVAQRVDRTVVVERVVVLPAATGRRGARPRGVRPDGRTAIPYGVMFSPSPAPMPRIARPPDRWSSVSQARASWAGWLRAGSVTDVPSAIVCVTCAEAAMHAIGS